MWNLKFADFLSHARGFLGPGISFETLVRSCADAQVASRLIKKGERDAWFEEATQFQKKQGTYERHAPDGRCFRFRRRRTKHNFTAVVWTDITDRKQARRASAPLPHAVPPASEEPPTDLTRFLAYIQDRLLAAGSADRVLIQAPDDTLARVAAVILADRGFSVSLRQIQKNLLLIIGPNKGSGDLGFDPDSPPEGPFS